MSKNHDGAVDYYAELGLDRGYSREVLLSMLEERMLEYQERLEAHADPELERRFELVLTALDVFSSDEERAEYDASLSPSPSTSEPPAVDPPVPTPVQPDHQAAADEPPAADPQESVSHWIDTAWRFLARGETDAAEHAAAKARSADPHEPGAYVVSAWVAYDNGRGNLYGAGKYVGQARLLNEGGIWRGRLAWLQGRLAPDYGELEQRRGYFREAIAFLSGEEKNEVRAELLRAYSATGQRWNSELFAEYQADFPGAEGGDFTKEAYARVGESLLKPSHYYDAARHFLMTASPQLPGSVNVAESYEQAALHLDPTQVRNAVAAAGLPPDLGEVFIEEAVARARLPEQKDESIIIRWIRDYDIASGSNGLSAAAVVFWLTGWLSYYDWISVLGWLSFLLMLGFPIASFAVSTVDSRTESDFKKHKARVARALGSKD